MTILFINHSQERCGVHQYGKRVGNIVNKSANYQIEYREVDNKSDFFSLISTLKPNGVIFNYHSSTMSWVDNTLLNRLSLTNIRHYGLMHEGAMPNFNYFISHNPDEIDRDNTFGTVRPIFEGLEFNQTKHNIPVIGSFGFGFDNKGFVRLCNLVNKQFDEAIIRLQITFAFFGDELGNLAKHVANLCQQQISKSDIKLEISHDFLDDAGILNFLSSNSLNAFLYDEMPGRGISSTIDYAISVKKPIAISNSYMFRHIQSAEPSINVDRNSLKTIIENGFAPLEKFRLAWSNENLIKNYENILNKTLK